MWDTLSRRRGPGLRPTAVELGAVRARRSADFSPPPAVSPGGRGSGLKSALLNSTVTVAATDPDAAETGPDTGRFAISRTGSAASALTVHYSMDGKAVNGSDYAWLSGSVIIPAGAASATVIVTPINDTEKEGNETVILTLSQDAAYTVGKPDRATVRIDHSDQPHEGQSADATLPLGFDPSLNAP